MEDFDINDIVDVYQGSKWILRGRIGSTKYDYVLGTRHYNVFSMIQGDHLIGTYTAGEMTQAYSRPILKCDMGCDAVNAPRHVPSCSKFKADRP